MPRKGSAGIGRAVARLREAKGWSQQQLAEAAGLSQPYVSKVESGAREPSLVVVQALARALGVKVDELLREDEA